jgi:hypothetical protein
MKPETTELRLFKAEDRYDIKGRGTVWTGPCPFRWDKTDGLLAWDGQWLISHPDADHTKTFKVIAVESFCLQVIRQGSSVGIIVKEIACLNQ